MAMKMLKKRQIHLLGSDCHNMADRKPDLKAATDKILTKLSEEAVKTIELLEKNIF